MKISIITVVYNNAPTIRDAIECVLSQTYPNIEYIIIDGASKDGTLEIIESYGEKISKFVSEPDLGIYDAMNKGICLATGEIIGILNSDDFYMSNIIIEKIVNEFKKKQTDCLYADLVYIQPQNRDKIIRYYDSSVFTPQKLAYGWMPAHPTFFVKKWVYEKYGTFKIDYKIAADYELITRFIGKYHISFSYLQEPIIKMRMGGISTKGIKSTYILNKEILRACRENGIYSNWAMILSKYPKKILGLFKR